MDLSKIRQMIITRKSKACLVGFVINLIVAFLVTKGWLSQEMGMMLIGGETIKTGVNVWGIAHEDAAAKSVAGGAKPPPPLGKPTS